MVVHLNSSGRAAVGVTVKPPHESFRRLETARPNLPLYLSLCVLYAAQADLRRGATDGHDKQTDRPLFAHRLYTTLLRGVVLPLVSLGHEEQMLLQLKCFS